MTKKLHTTLQRWLEAETGTDEGLADEALTALMSAIPRAAPSSGFAERILMALESAPAHNPFASWAWRSILAAAIAAVAIAAPTLPFLRLLPVGSPSFGEALKAAASGLTVGLEWLGTGLAVWELIAQIGFALRAAAATPTVLSALLATTLLGALALYGLNRVLAFERRAL